MFECVNDSICWLQIVMRDNSSKLAQITSILLSVFLRFFADTRPRISSKTRSFVSVEIPDEEQSIFISDIKTKPVTTI